MRDMDDRFLFGVEHARQSVDVIALVELIVDPKRLEPGVALQLLVIAVGDLGEKLGYNSIDNGYLSFNQVRISRSSMLSRFVKIKKTGDMEMKAHPKLLYMVMVMTRLHIINGGVINIFRACLVATRYAICRR